MMVVSRAYHLLIHSLIGAELMLAHQSTLRKKLHCVVDSGSADVIRAVLHIHIKSLYAEMVVVRKDRLQNRESFRSFAQPSVVEIFSQFRASDII